jgi:hypothetical protein
MTSESDIRAMIDRAEEIKNGPPRTERAARLAEEARAYQTQRVVMVAEKIAADEKMPAVRRCRVCKGRCWICQEPLDDQTAL